MPQISLCSDTVSTNTFLDLNRPEDNLKTRYHTDRDTGKLKNVILEASIEI